MGNHCGHCGLYTLVAVQNNAVVDVEIVPNASHPQGGCMALVDRLVQMGVGQLIAGGMGLQPLMGFNHRGIDVYFGNGALTVGDAVKDLLNGRLKRFGEQNTCKGGCSGH